MKLHYIKSSFYSLIHSPVLLVSTLAPLCGALVFLLYYAVRSLSLLYKFSFFTISLAGIFPLMIAVIVTIIEGAEATSGFGIILTAPSFKFQPHVAKLFAILVFGLFSSLFAMSVFCLGMHIEGNTALSFIDCLETGAILLLGNIPLCFLQYIISFSFGKGASLGFGIIGTVLSMVFLTGIGEKIRMFLPWGFSGEFLNCFISSKQGVGVTVNYTSLTQTVISCVIATVVLAAFLIIWANRYEGRKTCVE